MFNNFNNDHRTKSERLLTILSDYEWHSTRELSRRVGHTFACAKFKLARRGYLIEVEPHPSHAPQYRYRLRRPRLWH